MDLTFLATLFTDFGIPGGIISAAFFFLLTGRVVQKSIVDGYKEEIKELKATIKIYQERGDRLYLSGAIVAEKAAEVSKTMFDKLPNLSNEVNTTPSDGDDNEVS